LQDPREESNQGIMFRRLCDGMRDVARPGSEVRESRSPSNLTISALPQVSFANRIARLRNSAHRRGATIDGTCSRMDQSLSYARLRVGDLVHSLDAAYFGHRADAIVSAPAVDSTSWFRERMRMHAVSNALTLDW
jgi:hypothetical protein